MTNLKDLDPYKMYLNWKKGTDVFECFFKSTPFVCLKNYPDFELSRSDISFKEKNMYNETNSIIKKYNRGNSIFLLDLPGEKSIKLAFLLQNITKIKPILTFNAILHPYGLIEQKDFINNLVLYSSNLNYDSLHGYIFILDKNRYIESDGKEENFFNNQYETTEEDMPNIEFLKELNYENVIYIYNGSIKEDINCYLEYLEHFNINVYKCRIGDQCYGQ